MAQVFNGAVVCTKMRIDRALSNYTKRKELADKNVEAMLELAKKTTIRCCIFFKTSVYNKHFNGYFPNLSRLNKDLGEPVSSLDITLSQRQAPDSLKSLSKMLNWPPETCYISPEQAAFVTKWESYY